MTLQECKDEVSKRYPVEGPKYTEWEEMQKALTKLGPPGARIDSENLLQRLTEAAELYAQQFKEENSRLLEEKAKLIEQIEHFRKVASENKIQSGAGTFSSAKFGGRMEMCEEILKALTSPQ